MLGRTPVAGLVLGLTAVAGLLPSVAFAQTGSGTVDQAAAGVRFPVFQFTRTLGYPVSTVDTRDYSQVRACRGRAGQRVEVLHDERPVRGRKRRWLFVGSAARPCPGSLIGYRVRRVRVLGKRAWLRGYCLRPDDECSGTVRDTRRYSVSMRLRADGQSTRVDMAAGRMPLRLALRAFRSVRRVDITRPVVELTNFRSPDGAIWCGLPVAEWSEFAFCGTRKISRAGRLYEDGHVDLCDQAPGGCLQNWDFEAPMLAVGQTSSLNGYACVAVLAGQVSCTLTEGDHAGRGFTIDAGSVREIVPPPSPLTAPGSP